MRAAVRATLATVTTLAALGAAAAHAGAAPPEQPRPSCTMPESVAGQYLIFYGSKPAVPGSPAGDVLTLMHFTGPTSYRHAVFGATPWRTGDYTYRRAAVEPLTRDKARRQLGPSAHSRKPPPDLGTAVIDATGPDRSRRYSVLLTCRTSTTGHYRLLDLPPDHMPTREDVMVYRFLTPAR